jgi:hypothetical protein
MTGRKMGRCTHFGKALKEQNEGLNMPPEENLPDPNQGGRGNRGRGGRKM